MSSEYWTVVQSEDILCTAVRQFNNRHIREEFNTKLIKTKRSLANKIIEEL